ncbi:MAG: pancreas/duodenum homeobox protein 1 [Proteobacteria bacterium]|nr:pancreas/duodenum homeobox protein 1 [Pseudomonadota bacterium]MBU1386670.1 pancreas/duodenum homeobox protein 1 [Pseudomonadota bacterium]MBU1543281.1 pancreas/duodenum homeobox protein 1 [Pseudomonadota bacterium]MBU2429689.1 pancreas/duodenum homeobox protein 1 [Pseudomonadota bacterium]MBU2483112.1 pancreas/duodenum homeobox protein 1 [Pseudomonadota bacterium]
MDQKEIEQRLTQDFLDTLMPPEKSDQFFEALYGDASEGAYNIRLKFKKADEKQIVLMFDLTKRPGKCLVCSLTYGLPTVFSRHPLINIKNLVEKIKEKGIDVAGWRLGETQERNSSNHMIPFYLDLV